MQHSPDHLNIDPKPYAKYHNPRQGFSVAIMVESKKGHNLVNFSRNSLKSYSGHLNIHFKPYAKY